MCMGSPYLSTLDTVNLICSILYTALVFYIAYFIAWNCFLSIRAFHGYTDFQCDTTYFSTFVAHKTAPPVSIWMYSSWLFSLKAFLAVEVHVCILIPGILYQNIIGPLGTALSIYYMYGILPPLPLVIGLHGKYIPNIDIHLILITFFYNCYGWCPRPSCKSYTDHIRYQISWYLK